MTNHNVLFKVVTYKEEYHFDRISVEKQIYLSSIFSDDLNSLRFVEKITLRIFSRLIHVQIFKNCNSGCVFVLQYVYITNVLKKQKGRNEFHII